MYRITIIEPYLVSYFAYLCENPVSRLSLHSKDSPYYSSFHSRAVLMSIVETLQSHNIQMPWYAIVFHMVGTSYSDHMNHSRPHYLKRMVPPTPYLDSNQGLDKHRLNKTLSPYRSLYPLVYCHHLKIK